MPGFERIKMGPEEFAGRVARSNGDYIQTSLSLVVWQFAQTGLLCAAKESRIVSRISLVTQYDRAVVLKVTLIDVPFKRAPNYIRK